MRLNTLLTGILAFAVAPPAAAQVVNLTPNNSDAIIRDNLCLGDTCPADISTEIIDPFASSLIIKDTRTRIDFSDSSASDFPGDDWSIIANDVKPISTGGIDRFAIENRTEGTTPFQIVDNAPSNSIFVAGDGNIGLGTTAPQSNIHIIDSGTPGIRIATTSESLSDWYFNVGSTGLAFFNVSDATNAPLVFENGAPTGTIWAKDSGIIGMGTDNPETGLHISRSDGNSAILIEETSAGTLGQMTLRNNGITFFTLEDTSIAAGNNTGRAWNFQNQAGTFRVTTAPGGPGEIEMIMTPAGDMTIKGSLTTGGGTCGGGCDAVFSDEYDLPSIPEHAEAMWSLGHLPNVGPTVENEPINISDKLGRMLNALEYAHIYIAQQEETISVQNDQIAALMATVETLSGRLERIETTLRD